MTYTLLEAVQEARELRDAAEEAFVTAVQRAKDGGHSLRECAHAAGMTRAGIQHVLRKTTGKEGS